MRSYLEFRSAELLDDQEGDAPSGERVARLLADELPKHGFVVEFVHPEDWGWRVQLANASFTLWIGCGHYQEFSDGHLCFVEPSKPMVRRWFKRIPTVEIVEQLASALETIIRETGKAHGLRWWTDAESQRG